MPLDTPQRQKITFDVSLGAILKVVGVILALSFLYVVRDIVIVLIVAIILAALINPVAEWFARKRIPRALGVLFIYLVLIGILALVVTLLVPPIVEQFGQLSKNFSGALNNILEKVAPLKDLVYPSASQSHSPDVSTSLQSGIFGALSGVFSTVTSVLGGLVSFVLILALAFYIVMEGDAFKKFFKSIAPERYQPHLVGLMTRAQHKMGQWLRGSLILMLLVGTLDYIGLLAIGVKYALALAILAGILELIPYLGPPLSAVPAVILAFSQSPIKGLAVIILYVVVQELEAHVFTPKIMQKTIGLNPVVSILSLAIGYQLAGILGALLAIPVATAISVFVSDLIELQKKKTVG